VPAVVAVFLLVLPLIFINGVIAAELVTLARTQPALKTLRHSAATRVAGTVIPILATIQLMFVLADDRPADAQTLFLVVLAATVIFVSTAPGIYWVWLYVTEQFGPAEFEKSEQALSHRNGAGG
jgi:hypothetical protein